jgi:hypothetical protein
MNPVEVKMPVPIMFETTSAVALATPNCRTSATEDDFSVADAEGGLIL